MSVIITDPPSLRKVRLMVKQNVVYYSHLENGHVFYDLMRYMGNDEYGLAMYEIHRFPVPFEDMEGDYLPMSAPASKFVKYICRAVKHEMIHSHGITRIGEKNFID